MNVREIDHIVLTVTDIEKSLRFYHEVFDMPIMTFDDDRKAVLCGKQKINFQLSDHPHNPVASSPPWISRLVYCGKDSCLRSLITSGATTLISLKAQFKTGAHGKLTSVYVRDPDGNLIEISNY